MLGHRLRKTEPRALMGRPAILCAAFFLTSAGTVLAQEGGLDILDGETIWAEGAQVSLSEVYRRKATFYVGSDRASDPLNQALLESRTTLGVNYGVLPELTLAALIPFVYRELRFDGPSGRETDAAGGLGNMTLIAKYRVYKEDWHLGSFNWTVFAGGELPTGATHERDGGMRLSPELQPGSGSWGAIFATAATFEVDRWKLNGVFLFERNGEGAQDFKFGDLLVAELTLGRRLVVEKYPGPLLRADLGVQWRHEFASIQGGQRLPDSSGDTVLLKPGIVFWPRPWWGMIVSAEVPVWRNLRGGQIGLDYGLFASVSYRF